MKTLKGGSRWKRQEWYAVGNGFFLVLLHIVHCLGWVSAAYHLEVNRFFFGPQKSKKITENHSNLLGSGTMEMWYTLHSISDACAPNGCHG